MLFHSIAFLVFIINVYMFLCVFKENKNQKLILLGASYVFYMWWNPIFILLVLYSTLIDYYSGSKIYHSENQKSKMIWLWVSIIANLSMLFFFKYFNFFQDNLFYFLQSFDLKPSWTMIHVILPLGISFFTFQSMSYSVDVYRGKLKPIDSLLDFSLYISFFPQMIAGPIVRAIDFLPQLLKSRKLNFGKPVLLLFAKGLFKKVIIADNLAYLTGGVFNNLEMYSGGTIVLTSIFCYIQLYCDFSGYSDMAIALGKSMGFTFPENFKKPMHAKSFTDFWRRWHITLSTWFRDYVYYPLGGGRNRVVVNIFIVMVISGFWHGSSWNFILWGLFHAVVLTFEKLFKLDKVNNLLYKVTTQVLFALSLILFWSGEKGMLNEVFNKLSDFSYSMIGVGYLNVYNVILLTGIFIFFQYILVDFHRRIEVVNSKLYFVFWIIYGVVFYCFSPTYEQAFIYFQF